MIRGIIFDLDGTLLDTLTSLGKAFNRCLSTMQLPTHPIDAYRHFIGDGVYKAAERCLPVNLRDPLTIERLVAAQRHDYGNHWHEETAPYHGIGELLGALTSRQIGIAVLSNKDDLFARQCIDHFFPGVGFKKVQGYTPALPHKPDPRGAKTVQAALSCKTSEILFVGDTRTDIETARACMMKSVGVLWGFRDAAELIDAGADHLIASPEELLPILRL